MEKGILDLIPAAVEAVKQEAEMKMKLFSSVGKAGTPSTSAINAPDLDELTKLVAAEVAKYLKK